MEPKLRNISKSHFKFVNDQVLTADKLNSLIDYFDEQERLSRVFLTGIGIVCGFDLRKAGGSVFISPGVGVTSDGDILQFRSPGTSKGTEKLVYDELEFSHCRSFLDLNANYSRFRSEGETFELWELLPRFSAKTLDDSADLQALDSLDLGDKVVMLYFEAYTNKGDLCNAIDCDNQGEEQVARLRVIMLSEYNAKKIAESDPVFLWHDIDEKYASLPEIKPLRVALGGVNNTNSLRKSFGDAINSTVLNKVKQGYHLLSQILGTQSLGNQINQKLHFTPEEFSALPDFQYRYDLVRDLIATYNEIKEILLKINSECLPSVNSFPKHLFLGKIVEENVYKTLRHKAYKSALSRTEKLNREKVISLYLRARQQLLRYNVQLAESVERIKITPSKVCSKNLGENAIPYYYNVNDDVLETWSYEKTINLKQKFNLSYHVQHLAADPEVRNPISFNTDEYELFRVEGCLGLNAKESRDKIETEIQKYGLDFDCRVLELENGKNSFTDFVKTHPSLVHLGGVAKGGTFVLLAADQKVVADFCLSYKISESNKQDCCSLMECSYPWISTLKYLNNLARSINGTQSRTKFMPKNYVLEIVEYKINGEALIDYPVQVPISLQDIYKRRMHAVTEEMNTRFKRGVVFDFNESQKRFLIIRAKEDRYTIRLRDITFNRNGAIYTFSNNGMFRNDLVFRADAMRCRDLKEYNPLFYEELQRKIAPVNKDDDYGKFYKKWDEWYDLRDRLVKNQTIVENKLTRIITRAGQLPTEIQAELRSLKSEFNTLTETSLNFMLDGDWVTGEWVNSTMLDHYRRNRSNKDDEIVRFVNLRKTLHSETGTTKLSLYITNELYGEVFEPLIKKYSGFADIYFGTPSGENSISV